jgi:ribonuclease P protein component
VRQEGRSVANPLLVLIQKRNPVGDSRFGIAVGKKVGGAVTRNRVKRRLREHTRLMWDAGRIRPGADVVIIARNTAGDASYGTLSRALDDLLRRGGLIVRRKEEAE